MELRDYLTILNRRKFLILAVAIIIIALWYCLTLRKEVPLYRATAKTFHAFLTRGEFIFRTTTGETLQQYISLAERLEFAKSEDVAKLALEYLKEGAILKEHNKEPITLKKHPEITLEYIRRSCQPDAGDPGRQAFFISAISANPQDAIDMANAMAFALKVKLKEMITAKLDEILKEYINRVSEIEKEIKEEEKSLADMKKDIGFDPGNNRLDEELKIARTLKSDLERQLIAQEGDITALTTKLSEAQKKGERLEKGEGVYVSKVETKEYKELTSQIADERTKLFELRRKYKEDHPNIRESIRKIAYLLIKLDDEERRMAELEPKLLQEKKNELIAENGKVIANLNDEILGSRERASSLRQNISKQEAKIEDLQNLQEKFAQKKDTYFAQVKKIDVSKKKFEEENKRKEELEIKYRLMPDLLIVESPAKEAHYEGKRSQSQIPFIIIIALILGIGFGYLAEYTDDRIRTAYDIKKYLNWQTIGIVPRIKKPQDLLIVKTSIKSPIFEIYGRIAAVLGTANKRENARSFVFLSVSEKEGKSTIAANTATAFAKMGKSTVLVDADLRRPSLHRMFGADNSNGLSTYLSGKLSARATLKKISKEQPELEVGDLRVLPQQESISEEGLLKETPAENLRLITSGPVSANPTELLESHTMKNLASYLKEKYDVLIFDSPPIEGAVDPLILAGIADRVILVVSCLSTRKYQVSWGKRMLDEVGAKTIGVVLNRSTVQTRGYYHYYYGTKSYVEREKVV